MDQLQQLGYDLHMAVRREIGGHDRDAVASWADDFAEETFKEAPRPLRLRIYLDEIEKRTPPRARELRELIEAIKQVVA